MHLNSKSSTNMFMLFTLNNKELKKVVNTKRLFIQIVFNNNRITLLFTHLLMLIDEKQS